ncbi:autotransporter-associated beta strand repeat-containing protein [Afipia sp. P52-10]|uniref:autotransporter-associated beta strand repeat-containing protein n=1 Tax=Afipia sp. P52-10 TaxID=1429916 RepID=UPI0004AE38E5|nr:autotransporter-associated beta strand repeat-containing protein [Afipia sp. P52-10]
MQGNGTLQLQPGAGHTQTIADVIADQTGSGGSGTYATGGPVCTVGAGCAGYSGAGSWALEKSGAGTLILSGANTYTGGTTLSAGVVSVGADNNLGDASGALTFNGGILQVTGTGFTSTARTINWGADGGSFDIADAANIFSVSQALTGAGSLQKLGAGTLALSGANTYSGTTRIDAGTLQAGAVNTFSANSAHVVAAGAVLNLGDHAQTIGSLAGAGNVTLGTGTLTAGGDNSSTIFSGNMSGSSLLVDTAFNKQGTGTLILSGANTYSGMTEIAGGTLQAGATNTLSANSLHLLWAGAVLDLNNFDQTIVGLGGSGSVTLGSGTLTLAGDPILVATSFGGAISGTGGIVKDGSFTQRFGGANTYSGTTSINAGRLWGLVANAFSANSAHVVAAGAVLDLGGHAQTIGSLAGTGNVNLGAGTLIAGGDDSSTNFSGVINGSGGLIKQGAGTFTLSGASTYSGGTTINAGVLALAGSGTLGNVVNATTVNGATAILDLGGTAQTQAEVALQNGGTLRNGSLTGAVTSSGGAIDTLGGAASVNVTDGVTVMTGVNTYSGGNLLGGGTLSAGADTNLGAAASGLNFNGGILQVTGTGFTSTARAITWGADGGGFDITDAANRFTLNQTFSGGGRLEKLGAGALVLNGTHTYAGDTVVTAGVLEVAAGGSIASDVTVNGGRFVSNGSSLGTTTVNAGGTLGGDGIVGTTAIDGGTLSPGNSVGMLTVQGNLSFTAASTYRVEVDPANADRTNVTGTATLGGATVAAIYAPGSYVTRQYAILNAAGGVNGTFASLVNTNLPTNFTPSLSYDANNAYLNLTLNFVPPDPELPVGPNFGGGLNVNQSNVAAALVHSFNTAGGIPLAFGALTPQGLTQVPGEVAAGTQQATFNVMSQFLGAMLDPFAAGRDGESRQGVAMPYADEALAYASARKGGAKEREAYVAMLYKAPRRIADASNRWSVWASGFGGTQATGGNAIVGSADTTTRIYGMAAGADYRFSPDTLVGFAVGGAGTSYNLANGLGKGTSEVFQAGVYGRHQFGAAYVAGALAYGWQDVTTDRTVFGVDRLRARFDANALSGRLESGYRFAWQSMNGQSMGVTTYAAGQFTTLFLPGYAEEVVAGGNLFALNYASKDVTSSRSELGLRADTSFAFNDALIILRGRAAWAHNFDTSRSTSANV